MKNIKNIVIVIVAIVFLAIAGYYVYDVYKEIYKEEDLIDAMNNPTSSGSGLSFCKKN